MENTLYSKRDLFFARINFFIKEYKKPLISFFIFLLLVITLVAFCQDDIYEHADSWGQLSEGARKGKVYEWIDDIFGGNIKDVADNVQLRIEETNGNSLTIVVANKFNLSTYLGPIMREVNKVCCSVGVMIATILFCINLIQECFKGHDAPSYNELFRTFMYFAIALGLIVTSLKLFTWVTNIGVGTSKKIYETVSIDENSDNNTMKNQIDKLKKQIYDECHEEPQDLPGAHPIKQPLENFGKKVENQGNYYEYMFSFFLPWIVSQICKIICLFACWSRAVQIIIYVTVSPIALADVRDFSPNTGAARYLRNLLSLALQGAFIILVCAICAAIQIGIVTNGDAGSWDTIVSMCSILLVQLGMVNQTSQMAKTLVGLG